MHFQPVNVIFYDGINMIQDVNTTSNPFLYTAKFRFASVRNNKLNKSDAER